MNIIDQYSHPLNIFMDELSKYVIVYFDENYNILDFNKAFSKCFNIQSSELKNKKISDLMTNTSLDQLGLSIKSDKDYLRKTITFKKDFVNNKIHPDYNAYFFKTNDYYCMIANRNSLEKTIIINQIAKLTNQLTNESRELNRANDQLKKANKKIEHLLRIDELTKMSNRKHFMEFYKKIFARAKRHGNKIALIMCDVDNFKEINDNYGHDAGDKVLIALGKVFKKETREDDISARIGGEEFIVLSNNTSLKNSQKYAERIRKKVSEIKIDEVPRDITLSLGIACLKPGDTEESFLKRADQAMYQSKNNGKNRVFFFE